MENQFRLNLIIILWPLFSAPICCSSNPDLNDAIQKLKFKYPEADMLKSRVPIESKLGCQPFIAVHEQNGRKFTFVGCIHEKDETMRLTEYALSKDKFEVAIGEYPSVTNTLLNGKEPQPYTTSFIWTRRLMHRLKINRWKNELHYLEDYCDYKIPLMNFEPAIKEVKENLETAGLSLTDLIDHLEKSNYLKVNFDQERLRKVLGDPNYIKTESLKDESLVKDIDLYQRDCHILKGLRKLAQDYKSQNIIMVYGSAHYLRQEDALAKIFGPRTKLYKYKDMFPTPIEPSYIEKLSQKTRDNMAMSLLFSIQSIMQLATIVACIKATNWYTKAIGTKVIKQASKDTQLLYFAGAAGLCLGTAKALNYLHNPNRRGSFLNALYKGSSIAAGAAILPMSAALLTPNFSYNRELVLAGSMLAGNLGAYFLTATH